MISINKNIIIRILIAILIILTIAFIWSNSLDNASESSEKTNIVIDLIKPIVDPDDSIDDDVFTHVIRKLAHFSEFTLLGSELTCAVILFVNSKKKCIYHYIVGITAGFVVAITDEHLQLLSHGRSCQLSDMLIDLSGIVSGTIFVIIVCSIASKFSKRHN